MIITKQKPFEEILGFIKGHNNIFIVGCGSCAEQCKTGGKEDVAVMADKIKKHGKNVTGFVVPDETCHIPLTKKELRKLSKELDNSDAVIVMACGVGVSSVREAVKHSVYPASDTISLGNTARQGVFLGRCSLCGECVLGETGGYCPVTICPKSMQNGPCGGMDKGKCEVNTNEDCIWVKIYDIQASNKNMQNIRKVRIPKDNSKTRRGSRIEAGVK